MRKEKFDVKHLLNSKPGDIAPFPLDEHTTQIVIAYRNMEFIADMVFPIVPVASQEFKYLKLDKGEAFTIPDTKVGRKSSPNLIEVSATEVDGSTKPYGLKDVIPQDDIDNAPENFDPEGRAAERLIDLVLLDHERRCANLAQNLSNYSVDNQDTLAGGDQFSDYVNSKPITKINESLDSMVMRANKIIFGRRGWSITRGHPDIVKAINATAGDTGLVSRQAFADLFELDEVIVGVGWYNTAKKGQDVTLERIWGNDIILIYQDPLADTRGGMTYGFTASFGERESRRRFDESIGLRGAVEIKTGHNVKPLITANDLGFILKDAVA
jgi:hypothetical protein